METQRPLADWVADFARYLEVERGASSHTVAGYRSDLMSLSSEGPFRVWSAEELRGIEREWAAAFRPRSVRRKVAALRAFLRFLAMRGLATPTLPKASFARSRPLPKSLSAAQTTRVGQEAGSRKPSERRDAALVVLLSSGGLRISEAVGLTLEDWTPERAEVRVRGKGGRTRIVPLPPEAAAMVEEYVASARGELWPKHDLLLVSDRGNPLRREVAFRTVQRLARAAGLGGSVGPHTLRHSYAVALLKGGADLRAVQELLGHASIATTQIYTELDLDAVRARFHRAHPRG